MSAVPKQPAQASRAESLTALRLQLHRNGYVPVPVVSPNATWAKSPGKQPGLGEDWLNKAKAADEDAIRAWPQSDPGCPNTGIVTGTVTAVDVDVPVLELAKKMLELANGMLPAGALRRSAGGPKFLLLLQGEPGSKKTMTPKLLVPVQDAEPALCQVEVMATGQQIVAYGRHLSGKPYIWHGSSPENTARDQLPLVTKDQIAAFLVAAEELLREAGGLTGAEIKAQEKEQKKPPEDQPLAGQTTGGSPSPQGAREGMSPLHRLNQVALEPPNLKLWVPVLFPAATLHESTGAWRVTSDDLGRSLEEDLSIAPTGIRDFGEETSQTPVGLVIEYGEAAGIVGEDKDERGKAAAKWLAGTIGKSWPADFQDSKPELKIGSDVEIAGKVAEKLRRDHSGRVVAAEGQVYRWADTHWTPIPDRELRLLVHQYDGAIYPNGAGRPEVVKLSTGKINSILTELTAVLGTDEAFFHKPTAGINSLSGLIRIMGKDKTARVEVLPHDPEHRHRHVIQGEYYPERNRLFDLVLEDPLLGTLLDGSFKDEPDASAKWSLLAEVAGVAAAGAAPLMGEEQQAVILLGETAGNGKSQFLDLMRGMLPAEAVCSIPPAEFQDEKNRMGLAGKLLNATDEMSSASAISADLFKAIVTCDTIRGRDLYKKPVDFRPQALHVMNTNGLPPIKGGLDRGVKRRLMVVPFNRVIPKEERIPNLGRRIAHEEMDLLLAWAVDGLLRVARNGWKFTELAASADQIEDWLEDTCSVTRWLKSGSVIFVTPPGNDEQERPVPTARAYDCYRNWAKEDGLRPDQIVSHKTFTTRVKVSGLGPIYKRTNAGRFFLNLTPISLNLTNEPDGQVRFDPKDVIKLTEKRWESERPQPRKDKEPPDSSPNHDSPKPSDDPRSADSVDPLA
jgi:putative DNA primase/helicase